MKNPLKTEENCKDAVEILKCYESSDSSTATLMRALVKKFHSKNIAVVFDGGVVLMQGTNHLRAIREEEK